MKIGFTSISYTIFALALIVMGLPMPSEAAEKEDKLEPEDVVTKIVTPSGEGPFFASIGDPVLHVQDKIDEYSWATLEPFEFGNLLFRRKIPSNTLLYSVKTQEKFKACTYDVNPIIGTKTCFIDDDGDGKFDRYSGSGDLDFYKNLKGSLKYGFYKSNTKKSEFEYIIKFMGADLQTIRFSYREFKSNLAREAFTEDLVVPREKGPQIFQIKGHTIIVDELNGMGLKYRLK